MTNSELQRLADSIGRLEDDRKAASEAIADHYKEAKDRGYTVAALRNAIKLSRMDAEKRAKHESEQSDLLLYLAEIEGRSLREAAE
jgi:uncharacterized protein (UPF0335 family)